MGGEYHEFPDVISDDEQRSHETPSFVSTKVYGGGKRGGLCRH